MRSSMRFRVDTHFGYVSYDEADEAKARALYKAEGLRLRRCVDLFDDVGVVLEGLPLGVDFRKAVAA